MKQTLHPTIEDCFSITKHIAIKPIPEPIYQKILKLFLTQYHFKNGAQMQIATHYITISSSLASMCTAFIQEIQDNLDTDAFALTQSPDGFCPAPENLSKTEKHTDFCFGSFDMAVTDNGLENIEFQAVATYPVSAAKLNQCLLEADLEKDAYIFADSPTTTWQDFTNLTKEVLCATKTQGVVLVDKDAKKQKTNFEFYATQKEINPNIAIVDMEAVFQENERLYYTDAISKEKKQIHRFYNRILLADALFIDHYPKATNWRFRFDTAYKELTYCNHPIKQYTVSKRLSPYIKHPLNPDALELETAYSAFKTKKIAYLDYIWKHKWGAAGHRLYFNPSLEILESLKAQGVLKDYIAQKKVFFHRFISKDDGLEKIIELRFMTTKKEKQCIIVPMARIGHVCNEDFKIHFKDNNKKGYGFSPVLIKK